MTLSLYTATVPSFLQILRSVTNLLGKAEAFCADHSVNPADIIAARLAEDMLPFSYQVKSTVVHSIGAIEGLRRGAFAPDRTEPPQTFAALKATVENGISALEQVEAAELNGLVGRELEFTAGEYRLLFTAEEFLLSFSQPNFYFHATTAYAILRAKGVSIGKRDFIGQPRVKP